MKELKNLFSRAAATFKLFIATLENVIVFDTDGKSETELLTKGERFHYALTIL